MKESSTTTANENSAFKELGLKKSIEELKLEVQELYQSDQIPWVIGYSGGKDSTASLQIVWLALQELPKDKLHKEVHVISTDTMVENPIVASWVSNSLKQIQISADEQGLPIIPHRLTPELKDSFWVNLIGKGYPAPRHKFRWCTERLKINPSNKFIKDTIRSHGEAILVLGMRKAESSARHAVMKKNEKGSRIKQKLNVNGSLPNAFVYNPIGPWTNDDVWLFLMQTKNPWGYKNSDLLTMYQGASADGECPLVVDTTTASCGNSRFGCWVCTMVEQDKSMNAMIQNDAEKEWMMPLLKLRNKLDFRDANADPTKPAENDRDLRDFRRMNGSVQIFKGRAIHGPYLQETRATWLRELLEAQTWIRKNGPEEVRDLELISLDEINEIRRIWVVEKHEMEDLLPQVYKNATGEEFPGRQLDELAFGAAEMEMLSEICGENQLDYELTRELLDIERRYLSKAKRRGLYDDVEKAFRRHFYSDEQDALDFALRKKKGHDDAEELEIDVSAKVLTKLEEAAGKEGDANSTRNSSQPNLL